MAAGIATGFVRKLYRILDQESSAIIAWDASGASFSILDSERLNEQVLPRYFRGRLSAFRQQLVDHGFQQLECEDNESREAYAHDDFRRGCPGRLSRIVRTPKAKKRKGGDAAPPPPPPPPTTSLRVTLTAVGGKKRPGPSAVLPSPAKRLRADAASVPAAPAASKNPLFSNDPDDGAFSIARLVEGGGLLPASSELPDPISYLSRAGGGPPPLASDESAPGRAPQQQTTMTTTPAAFSDDLVRSALYFLVSTSVTGMETTGEGDKKEKAAATVPGDDDGTSKAPETRADVLASLLASSTSGMQGASTWGPGAAAGTSNPLFSDQSTGDEEDDENSIWNLLVASSVDRVRSAIVDVADPQAKLRLIIAERERLEAQRAKVGVPAVPVTAKSGRPVVSESAKPAANPLFAGGGGAKAERAAGAGTAATRAAVPCEDDLWRLLMSSSIDAFRSLEQHNV